MVVDIKDAKRERPLWGLRKTRIKGGETKNKVHQWTSKTNKQLGGGMERKRLFLSLKGNPDESVNVKNGKKEDKDIEEIPTVGIHNRTGRN